MCTCKRMEPETTQGMDMSNKTSAKQGDGYAYSTCRLRKFLSEGVVLLGPHPPYKMKMFPIVIVSAYVREIATSVWYGEQNTIELSNCPGNHRVFDIVESFCYGLVDDEDIYISNAGKLLDVCEFLCLQTLSARVLRLLEKHVLKSWDHCLDALATFDISNSLQTNKAFLICQSRFVDYIAVKLVGPKMENDVPPTAMCDVRRLYQAMDDLSPEMMDIMFNALANHCNKYFSEDVLLGDTSHVDCLTRKDLWFRRLCNPDERVDHPKIPKATLLSLLEALQKSRDSIFTLAMQERGIEMEEQAAEAEKKLRNDVRKWCSRYCAAKVVLKFKRRALDTAKQDLVVLRRDLKGQKKQMEKTRKLVIEQKASLAEASEKNLLAIRAIEDEKEKSLCQICMEEPRDTLCLPCSHFLYCSKCLSEHQKGTERKTCPACRGPVTGLLKCVLSL